MDDLTYHLIALCKSQREVPVTTRANRIRVLKLLGRQLRQAGFRHMQVKSLRDKHVRALLQRWYSEGLSLRTIEKRVKQLQWWEEQIGKANLLPSLVDGSYQHNYFAFHSINGFSDDDILVVDRGDLPSSTPRLN